MIRLILASLLLAGCASSTPVKSWKKKCFYDDRHNQMQCYDWPEMDPKK